MILGDCNAGNINNFHSWPHRRRLATRAQRQQICPARRDAVRTRDVDRQFGQLFGNVCVGSFKDEMLYLSNSGFNRVTVTAVTSPSSAEFVVQCAVGIRSNIAPEASWKCPIRFQPGMGPKSATITVTSNDPSGPKKVLVSGDAKPPRLAVIVGEFRQLRQCVRGIVRGQIRHFEQQRPTCTLSVLSLASSSGSCLVPESCRTR